MKNKKDCKFESVDMFVARGGEIKRIKTKIPKEYKYLRPKIRK